MVSSLFPRIALGRYDPWRRTPSLEILNGKIRFLPGKGSHGEFDITDAAFPPGARIEYRVQKGDMYFEGDHGQALGRTLWVIGPDGSRELLATGFVLYMDLTVATRNLEKRRIPFRAVSFYEGRNGEQIETELSISSSRLQLPLALLLGSSGLWLGVIAGLFVHSAGFTIGIGAFGFAALAIATLRSTASKRAALVTVASTLLTYPVGYAVSVLVVRSAVGNFAGR